MGGLSGAIVQGNYLTRLRVDADKTLTFTNYSAPHKKVVVYGDSILMQTQSITSANSPTDKAWVALKRAAFRAAGLALGTPKNWDLAVEGYGSRSLYLDVGSTTTASTLDVTKANAFVDYLSTMLDGTESNTFAMAIGTNDQGLNKWTTKALFKAAYKHVVQRMQSIRPTVTIICESPIISGTSQEAANASGLTKQVFRDAILEVASECSVTALDALDCDGAGTDLVLLANIPDNTHPNITGHAEKNTKSATAYGA
jgi:lysophospholipase L1-like esterase